MFDSIETKPAMKSFLPPFSTNILLKSKYAQLGVSTEGPNARL